MPYKKRDKAVKERIYDALIRLVSSDEEPYDQITIQEIVDEAGVCRNSFYRNFTSKDDIFIDKFREVATQSGKLLASLQGDFMTNIAYSFFETARVNRIFLLCFYKAAPKQYFDVFTDAIIRSNYAGRTNIPPIKHYNYAAKAWITVGILTEWMKRGCDMSVEDINDAFIRWCSGLITEN